MSGVVSGVGSVIKTQPGTLEFTAANTYDGGTTVSAGRLLANNATGSAFGTGDVVVASGATLGGTGFIGTTADKSNVLVSTGGHLAPGVAAGKLSVAGDVTWQTGSFFDVDFAGLTPVSQFDQLTIDGAATLSGTIKVSLLEGFAPAVGDSFPILSATGAVTGTFDGVASTGATGWKVVYGASSVTLVATHAGDFNGDGLVDASDLTNWSGHSGVASGASTRMATAMATATWTGPTSSRGKANWVAQRPPSRRPRRFPNRPVAPRNASDGRTRTVREKQQQASNRGCACVGVTMTSSLTFRRS